MSKLSSKTFRKRIRKRDIKCRICGKKTHLHIAHIKSRKDYPELRNEDSNAVVLCRNCEKNFGWKLPLVAESEKEIDANIPKKVVNKL